MVLCFGSRGGDRPEWWRLRRKKRSVPVQERKASLLGSCCFSPAACMRGRKRKTGGSSHHEEPPSRPQNLDSPLAETPSAEQQRRVAPSTADSDATSINEGSSAAARSGLPTKAAFGPTAGLCVVAAGSTAGLLGGRVLAAVVCVCAWLFALYRLKRAEGMLARGERRLTT